MKDDVVLLAHYDLDGAGVSVLSDHIWNVVNRKHQGYPKIRKHLDMLIDSNGRDSARHIDTIVIADLCIEPADLHHACQNFDYVIYYDHHESSEQFEKWPFDIPEYNIEVHFSLELCSTALMWIDGVKHLGATRTPKLDAFMNTVNAYDLWKKDNKRFNSGVIMNDMFWDLHLWDWKKRFRNGFDGFTPTELVDAADREKAIRKVCAEATIEECESGSKVVVINDASAINWVSTYVEGDIFYIIPPSFVAGKAPRNVSVRISDKVENFNVNDGITTLPGTYPDMIESSGGHAAAGGITFQEQHSINDMVDFLMEHDSFIRKVAKV